MTDHAYVPRIMCGIALYEKNPLRYLGAQVLAVWPVKVKKRTMNQQRRTVKVVINLMRTGK